MCPIWPLHTITLYLLPLFVTYTAAKQWKSIEFSPSSLLQIHMGSVRTVNFTIHNLSQDDLEYGQLLLELSDPSVLRAVEELGDLATLQSASNDGSVVSQFKSKFDIQAQFLGYCDIRIKLKHRNLDSNEDLLVSDPVHTSVIRAERVIDRVFTISVAALVSIIFVNFGCALDWPLLKSSLKVPIAPTIGFVSQFLFMPVISFVLARLLFPDSIPLQLGLFFTGVAPGGGASNVWIYTLGGNINLSITMTAVSTFAAFVMIPAWSFTLGRLIFADGNMVIPYRNITTFAVALVIPLAVGYAIQRRLPRVSQLMVRILKPFSGSLILFIVLFAVYTNLYLFKLFTWKIILAGAGLPWFGYLFGYIFARVMRQPPADILAIAIETGIQNTGISIFMLRFSLGQPEADMTTVVPVAVALMTPLPLLVYYIYYKYQARICPSELKTPTEIVNNRHEIVKFPLDNGGGMVDAENNYRNICTITAGGPEAKKINSGYLGTPTMGQNGVKIGQNGVKIGQNGVGGMGQNGTPYNNGVVQNGNVGNEMTRGVGRTGTVGNGTSGLGKPVKPTDEKTCPMKFVN
uniref:P3 protein n=1 Tax=Cacopsylla melanoneura TaxID=428564 RepID=A0A8D9FIE1_9HEMI